MTIWQGSEQILSGEDLLGPIIFKGVILGSLAVLVSGRTGRSRWWFQPIHIPFRPLLLHRRNQRSLADVLCDELAGVRLPSLGIGKLSTGLKTYPVPYRSFVRSC